MKDFISIAKILNFHGIKGELKLGFTKGKDEQISNIKEVFLYINGEYKSFNVSSVRFHKQFAIMKLKEFNNINDVLNKSSDIDVSSDSKELIKKASEHFKKAKEAQKNDDWASYGKEINALGKTLEQLENL